MASPAIDFHGGDPLVAVAIIDTDPATILELTSVDISPGVYIVVRMFFADGDVTEAANEKKFLCVSGENAARIRAMAASFWHSATSQILEKGFFTDRRKA